MATEVQAPCLLSNGFEWSMFKCTPSQRKNLKDVIPDLDQISGDFYVIPVFQKTNSDMSSFSATVEDERELCTGNVK